MKKLITMMMLAAFCCSAYAIDVPQQDTTKTRQDTAKKSMKKKTDKKTMKKKDWYRKDSLKNKDPKRDTTVRPPQK